MKNTLYIFVALAVLVVLVSCSTVESKDPPQITQKIFDAPGMTKDDLFNSSLLWAAGAFSNEKSVLAISDRISGLISINTSWYFNKSSSQSTPGSTNIIDFKIRIELKDSKFRITCYSPEFSVMMINGIRYSVKPDDVFSTEFTRVSRNLIDSIGIALKKNNSDW